MPYHTHGEVCRLYILPLPGGVCGTILYCPQGAFKDPVKKNRDCYLVIVYNQTQCFVLRR